MWIALITAMAQAASPSAMGERAALPAREVERSLTAPMGWSLIELGAWNTTSRGAWSATGLPVPVDGSWRLGGLQTRLRHGWGQALEAWVRVDLRAHSRGAMGRPLQERGWVDPEVGLRWGALEDEAAGVWLALDGYARAAAGVDGRPLDGPNPQLALSTGVNQLGAGVALRKRFGGLRLDGQVRAERGIPGFAGHVEGWLDSGWLLRSDAAALLQVGPLWAEGVADVRLRTLATVDGRPVLDSDGRWSSTGVNAGIQVSRGFRVGGGAAWPLDGTGWAFPGVEPLSPIRGVTGQLTAEVAL